MRDRLRDLIKSGYSGIFVKAHEQGRVEADLVSIVGELSATEPFNLYRWTFSEGLIKQESNGTKQVQGTTDPVAMLTKFCTLPERSIVIATDFHLFMESKNPIVIARLKDALRLGSGTNRVFLIVGCVLALNAEVEKEFTVIEYGLPDKDTLAVVLDRIAAKVKVELNGTRDACLDAASGLTCHEAEDSFVLSFIETGTINPAVVSRMKSSAVKKSGVLEILDDVTSFESVGGMSEVKDWLQRRKLAFSKDARTYGLATPKGIMLIGPPGTGKTMLCKATASLLGVPLLKMDGGRLFGGTVGESERNMRKAIATAEAIGNCVLVIDEAEKALSGSKSSNSTDGGTSARVLGTFLNWMQEKTSQVFIVATCNSVADLPPELLRKGRFDELFFVDLPSDNDRAEIWAIHIKAKGRDPSFYDIPVLVQATTGWVGSEIESALSEAMFTAYEAGVQPHEGTHLADAVRATVPISKTANESIEKLREWAVGRVRMASKQTTQSIGITPSRKIVNN